MKHMTITLIYITQLPTQPHLNLQKLGYKQIEIMLLNMSHILTRILLPNLLLRLSDQPMMREIVPLVPQGLLQFFYYLFVLDCCYVRQEEHLLYLL